MVHLIGITGGSGSGKSTFCRKIKERLTLDGFTVCFISSDWFYKTKPEGVTEYNYDTPTAFDFTPLIEAIKSNKITPLPSYDYINHRSIANSNTFDPNADFIIIEGIMLYNIEEFRKLIDTKIFVHTDLDACLARRILRDISERGRTVQSVITQWFKEVKKGYEEFIFPTMKYADYIFNNTEDSIDQNIYHDDKLSLLFDKLEKSVNKCHK
jgi:uridine kinase